MQESAFKLLIISPPIKQRDIGGQHLSLFPGINPHKFSDLFPFLKGLAFTYKRIITKGKEERARGRDVYTKKEEGRGKVILTSNNGVEANTLLVLILSIQSRSNSYTASGLTFCILILSCFSVISLLDLIVLSMKIFIDIYIHSLLVCIYYQRAHRQKQSIKTTLVSNLGSEDTWV